MTENENLVVTITNPPGGEGCEYRLTLPSGESVTIGDAQDAYHELAGIIDDAFDPPAPEEPMSPAERVKAILATMERLNVDIDDLILWGHIDEGYIIGTEENAFNAIQGFDIHENDNDMHGYQAQADSVNDELERVGLLRDDETDEHPEHDMCADGCGLDVDHDGPCLDKPGGREVCSHNLHAHVFQGQRLVHDHPHAGPHGYFGHDEDAGMPEAEGWLSDTPYIDLRETE